MALMTDARPPAAVQAPYRCVRHDRWDAVSQTFRQAEAAVTPFQTPAFLAAWYATIGRSPGIEPLILEISAHADGSPAMLWPLMIERGRGLREIRFADAGVSDNNAPLLGPGAPQSAERCAAAWSALVHALPAADVLRLQKMPLNAPAMEPWRPIFPNVSASGLYRHSVRTGEDFDAYFGALPGRFRKNMRRLLRVYERLGGTGFQSLGGAQAMQQFAAFEGLQAERMRQLGCAYTLDQPPFRDFYRQLVESGLTQGSVRFGALFAGPELVAGLLGLSQGKTVTYTRIASRMGEWASASLGRLVMEQAFRAAHTDGLREFDMSIGEHRYKAEFALQPDPLSDITVPLSWKGRAMHAIQGAARAVRRSPILVHLGIGTKGQRAKSVEDKEPDESSANEA